MRNKKVNKIAEIIDHVLKQVFGEASNLIYKYLETNYNVKRNEIAEKIDVFATGLESFLSTGAYVVERKILEDIYSNYGLLRRLELERTSNERDFAHSVRLLM